MPRDQTTPKDPKFSEIAKAVVQREGDKTYRPRFAVVEVRTRASSDERGLKWLIGVAACRTTPKTPHVVVDQSGKIVWAAE